MKDKRVLLLCYGALFAALTAVCAQLQIPIGPVPITMGLVPVLLCGALLKPSHSAASMAAYALMGLIGLPVFAGFQAGPGRLFGVTGGFILGYIPMVVVMGLMLRKTGKGLVSLMVAMVVGTLVCYACGTVQFMVVAHATLGKALSVCVLPFLLGDAAKIVVSALITGRLAKVIKD